LILSGYMVIIAVILYLQEKLRKALAEPVESLFDAADQTTWTSIRNVYKRETEAILPEFLKTLCGFEMEYAPAEEMVSKLRDYARSVVESKAKEESSKVLIHMKDRLIKFSIVLLQQYEVSIHNFLTLFTLVYRFTTVFSHDKDSIPRVWTGKEDVRAIAKEARSAVQEPHTSNNRQLLCFLFVKCIYAHVAGSQTSVCNGGHSLG